MCKKCLMLIVALSLSATMVNAQQDTVPVYDDSTSVSMEWNDSDVTTEDVPATNSLAPSLEFFGYIMTDDRMRIDGYKLNWQEYRFDLKAQARFGDRAKVFADIWVRGIHYPEVYSSRDLMFSNKVMPVDIDLREAYFDIYGLFTKNLDLRVGRQRIAWGTGDRFNPTDNLNPYDLEDIWDFGRHSASNALQLNYYAGPWTFTAVGIPWFSPAILPNSEWTPAFMPEFSLPEVMYDTTTFPGVTIPVYLTANSINDTIELPQRDLEHSPSFGFKVKRSLGAWDLSLSYVYTRDALPVLSRIHTDMIVDTVIINLPEINAYASANVRASLSYPVQKILGFDFAGSLWGIGLRGEAALFFPEKQIIKQSLHYEAPLFGIVRDSILPDSLLLNNTPYLKFLLGLDYTFRNGFYVNFQYLHGFLHERGGAELKDYFLLGADWPLLNQKLKLSLLNSGFQVNDWHDLSNQYAWMYMPEISYKPVDNAEIALGAHIIEGKGGGGFGRVHKNDDVYIRLKFNF